MEMGNEWAGDTGGERERRRKGSWQNKKENDKNDKNEKEKKNRNAHRTFGYGYHFMCVLVCNIMFSDHVISYLPLTFNE